MILVLSSERFSLLILVSVGNVSPPLLRSNKISRLQNISPYVSLKGPLVRSYDICPHVSAFTQIFTLLLSTFHHYCYVRTIVSLPSVSLRNVFTTFLRT